MSSIPPSLDDRDGKIWMDGELVDWRDAKIHVLSHTLHYGCGAFEGVRAYKTAEGTAIFRLAEHTERLFNSAKILRMTIPFSQEQLNEAQKQVVRENKLESCYLRPLIWIGSEKLGVSPRGNKIHAMVAAWSWGAYLGEEGMRRGIRVKTSSYTRHHVNITMTQAKAVSNYTNSILANMEALDDGYDEALLLDASGYDTQVFEFISLEHTNKNKMILAVKRAQPKPPTEVLAQIVEIKQFYGIREQCLETLLKADGVMA
jgi:branched-chain amino acid aminotransferase